MLRWTCRLRDALEGGIWEVPDVHGLCDTSKKTLSTMKEAEFVSSNGAFPHEFRWETFKRFWPLHFGHNPSYLILSRRNPGKPDYKKRVIPGCPILNIEKEEIHVLWLSPFVFVSSIKIHENDGVSCFHDYKVQFGEGSRTGAALKYKRRCFLYSLSFFVHGELNEPCLRMFQFLQHLTALLPADYFDAITLKRNCRHPQRCPIGHFAQFLSVVPRGVTQVPAGFTSVILVGNGTITENELRVVLSYPFHPTVRLEFDTNRVSHCETPRNQPFDASVSFRVMLDLLRQARHLRSVELPLRWDKTQNTESLQISAKITVQAFNLMIRVQGRVPSQWLHSIATIFDVEHIHLGFPGSYDSRSEHWLQKWLSPVMHAFLDGSLATNSFQVRLPWNAVMNPLNVVPVPCKSKTLRFFDIHNVRRVPRWDCAIFPSLVVNYWRIRLTQPLGKNVLPFAIAAVNQGIIYRKTTDHAPYDMDSANAGLIFALLNTCTSIWQRPSCDGAELTLGYHTTALMTEEIRYSVLAVSVLHSSTINCFWLNRNEGAHGLLLRKFHMHSKSCPVSRASIRLAIANLTCDLYRQGLDTTTPRRDTNRF
jgi:hypothetical protein